jgi:isoleucyl-tRNA synthetase
LEGLQETQRKFLNTLFYTYDFFATYANIDGWKIDERNAIPVADRPELDRWVLSKLHSLMQEVTTAFDDYDPTRATRAVQEFVTEQLSNWYVRLSRRRFWKGELNRDKISAYETLFECLMVTAQLMAPVAPFFADWLYRNLTAAVPTKGLAGNSIVTYSSVHLTDWPIAQSAVIDATMERRMALAQQIASLVHGLRKKHKLKVRQPLQKIVVPALTDEFAQDLTAMSELIAAEVNVLHVQVEHDPAWVQKSLKPNWKALGAKVGREVQVVAAQINERGPELLRELETRGFFEYQSVNRNATVQITLADVEIAVQDIPGYYTASENGLTVALDITLTDELRALGLAREVVNRLQNQRKDAGLEVTDRIRVSIRADEATRAALALHQAYVQDEVLATELLLHGQPLAGAQEAQHSLDDTSLTVWLQKVG